MQMPLLEAVVNEYKSPACRSPKQIGIQAIQSHPVQHCGLRQPESEWLNSKGKLKKVKAKAVSLPCECTWQLAAGTCRLPGVGRTFLSSHHLSPIPATCIAGCRDTVAKAAMSPNTAHYRFLPSGLQPLTLFSFPIRTSSPLKRISAKLAAAVQPRSRPMCSSRPSLSIHTAIRSCTGPPFTSIQ